VDGLVNVASYLCGDDLKSLFFTCSAMCTVAERTAREKVERISGDLLTGPIYIGERKDGFGQKKPWTHFEGKNDFGLRAPDDEKSWVGVYHYIEKVIEETYYFGFQMKGEDGDKDIVNRFINMRSEEKFSFGQTFSKVDNNDGPSYFVPSPTVGLMIRGGTVLVVDPLPGSQPVIIASKLQLPSTGITRVLCRVFAPGVGGARGNNRDAQSYKLGSIGILRLNQTDEGVAPNQWAQRQDVMEPWVKEETVFGFQYDADEGTMIIHGCSNLSRSSRYNSNRYTIRSDTPGDLHIGFELCPKQLSINKALLSVRNCVEEEWTKFLAHSAEHNAPIRGNNNIGADIFDPVHQLEVLNNAQGGPQPLRIRHQLFRQAVRNRRRERAAAEAANNNAPNNAQPQGVARRMVGVAMRGVVPRAAGGQEHQSVDEDSSFDSQETIPFRRHFDPEDNNAAAGDVQRVQIRVLEGGRRVAQMLPRNPNPQQQQAQVQPQLPRPRVGLVQLVNDRIIARAQAQQQAVQEQMFPQGRALPHPRPRQQQDPQVQQRLQAAVNRGRRMAQNEEVAPHQAQVPQRRIVQAIRPVQPAEQAIAQAQQLLHNAARAAPFNVGVAGQGAPRRIIRAVRPPPNAQPPQVQRMEQPMVIEEEEEEVAAGWQQAVRAAPFMFQAGAQAVDYIGGNVSDSDTSYFTAHERPPNGIV